MYRTVHILTVILFCLTLSATVLADDPQAVAEVKKFHEDYYKNIATYTVEQALECFVPEFIGYIYAYDEKGLKARLHMIQGNSFDPEDWIINMAGPDDLRKYVENIIRQVRALPERNKTRFN